MQAPANPRRRSSYLPHAAVAGTLLLLCAFAPAQRAEQQNQLTGTQSVADAVQAADRSARTAPPAIGAHALALASRGPIHILYVHGINQVGAGDSKELRDSICKYLRECDTAPPIRIYPGGPFAVGTPPPDLAYMGVRIWNTAEQWSASAPFIDRYRISGGGHTPIVVDEVNWWPIVYPLKCQWMIARDAALTGPYRDLIQDCNAPTQSDPANQGRYTAWQWIPNGEARRLLAFHRHAAFINRDFKNTLMDWGFSDAAMALGPIEQIVTAGIRQLLAASLSAEGVDAKMAGPDEKIFFVTHSLGSYLSLAALDPESSESTGEPLAQFAPAEDGTNAASYVAARTVGFYFLANQIELLELARMAPASQAAAPGSPAADPAGLADPLDGHCPSELVNRQPSAAWPSSRAILHWQSVRDEYVKAHDPGASRPQIIAWSDPNDLLSWNVPCMAAVRVVNLRVRNSAFAIPFLFVDPAAVHANYARNKKVFRVIFSPAPHS